MHEGLPQRNTRAIEVERFWRNMMFEAVLMSSWHVGVLFLLLRKVKKLFQTMDASGD